MAGNHGKLKNVFMVLISRHHSFQNLMRNHSFPKNRYYINTYAYIDMHMYMSMDWKRELQFWLDFALSQEQSHS